MKGLDWIRHISVALSIAGSAILLTACEKPKQPKEENNEAIMTEQSDNLVMLMTENGVKSYRFKTPLLEGYKLAKDPFMEFRKGIDIETYRDDDTTVVDSRLTADYAIYFEDRKLWETKGNVVARNARGETLYTQQLFWDQRSGRIYSNVDCKVDTPDGYWYGEGFESDESMDEWHFRRYRGRMWVDTEQNRSNDTVNGSSSAGGAVTGSRQSGTSSARPAEKADAAVASPKKQQAVPPSRSGNDRRESSESELQQINL